MPAPWSACLLGIKYSGQHRDAGRTGAFLWIIIELFVRTFKGWLSLFIGTTNSGYKLHVVTAYFLQNYSFFLIMAKKNTS